MAKYPRTLSPKERAAAARKIRSELKGTTGQRRSEIRAENMDPGPSDEHESLERESIQKEQEAPESATAFNFGHDASAKKEKERR